MMRKLHITSSISGICSEARIYMHDSVFASVRKVDVGYLRRFPTCRKKGLGYSAGILHKPTRENAEPTGDVGNFVDNSVSADVIVTYNRNAVLGSLLCLFDNPPNNSEKCHNDTGE